MNDTPSRDRLLARWRKATTARQNPAGPIAAKHATELAKFNERLDQLRTLAETTSDPLRSSTYEQIWRTMSEELGFIANDLDRRQITTDDLPASLRYWSQVGLSHLDTHDDRAAREIFATDLDADLDDARDANRNDQDIAVPAAQREAGIERSIRHAYDRLARVEGTGETPGWIGLAEVRAQLDHDTHQPGGEPYNRAEVDSALRRLALTDREPNIHLIAADQSDRLTDAEREAAVRLGDLDWHAILIDDTTTDQATYAEPTVADQIELGQEAEPADDDMPLRHGRGGEWETTQEFVHAGVVYPYDEYRVVDGELYTIDEYNRHHASLDDTADDTMDAEDASDDQASAPHEIGVPQEDDAERGYAATSPRLAGPNDPSESIETSACAAAVSRAAVRADLAQHRVAAEADHTGRDEQLAAWSHDDQVAEDQAMKNETAASDDAPSW